LRARIGIRREDKSEWERRVPLTPEHVRRLGEEHGVEVWIQPSTIRVFTDEEYREAGAKVTEDLTPCSVVFAVKEIPPSFFTKERTYVFFSHTIKGQSQNMPMLRRLLDLGCQLIDYEKIVDENGRRMVFFGNYAGLAGMIDSLWALGKRLEWEELPTPFASLEQAFGYESLEQAKAAVLEVGEKIASEGLPRSLVPLTVGLAGYGAVSRGAQEILDLLPVQEVRPQDLPLPLDAARRDRVYKVVFKEEHMVRPKDPAGRFELQDYYDHPEKYAPAFGRYLPHLTVLMNCIYWDKRYPRLVTKEQLRELYDSGEAKLKVVGDISCDIEGSIEFTVRATTPGEPVYVYDPVSQEATNGVEGRGPVVLAVDNLPCELPRESSTAFGESLLPLVPAIAKADYRVEFEDLDLPRCVKDAVIVYQGKLTPKYEYLYEYV